MTSDPPQRQNASVTGVHTSHPLHSAHSSAAPDTQDSQRPSPQKSSSQRSGEASDNEVVRAAHSVNDLSELWKLSAYKQLEGWRRSGP
jgi:hypothetical protein